MRGRWTPRPWSLPHWIFCLSVRFLFDHGKPDHHQLSGIHGRSLPSILELCALRAMAYPEGAFR